MRGGAERAPGEGLPGLADGLDSLDDQIIALLLRRAELARGHRSARRTAGLPASELTWENRVLARYGARLGRPGTGIGRAVLALTEQDTPTGTPAPH
ncbi:hypothetical protein JCM4814A_69210 [Streptomyces phaeofaciens JCM 4814]|uniref:Chorismate mutase n=1 Tax=Streptomyces phaeofaciens TaxID=68254 RepID=A0A918H6Z6_9ACTN|nr:chorismate mutase [Streptomyces phaeofaciens]GGT41789.1 hypothetical protein GCM10010226_17860 [Streptomyces phaeofaciens]